MNLPAQRRIAYVSGTRADFGLMASTLRAIEEDPRLSLGLIVTGMHLSEHFGMTVREIEAEDLSIAARVCVDVATPTGATMAANIGHMLVGFVQALQAQRPDILVILGDRGEMLAGALAAIHLGIPVVHLHGGERSGTVDEPVRHAISKLANLHLVSTSAARDRLVRMGEDGSTVHVVGAPGLDGLTDLATQDRNTLCRSVGFDPGRPVALLIYHPVLHEVDEAPCEVSSVVEAAFACRLQILALMPNSDAGSDVVREVLTRASREGCITLQTHLKRPEFVSWMAAADVMLGNSSSGIIEAATFGTPVVNVGSRQNLRERNANVIDVPAHAGEVRAALDAALKHGRYPCLNLYGDGRAGGRIVELLATTTWSPRLLAKCNAY